MNIVWLIITIIGIATVIDILFVLLLWLKVRRRENASRN